MSSDRIVIVALTMVLAALPASSAQAAWTAPQPVSGGANDVWATSAAFGADGRGLLTWVPSTYTDGHFVLATAQAATRPPGATSWSAQQAAPTFVAGPVLYGQTRAVGLDERTGSWNRCGQQVTLRARFGRSTGRFDASASAVASYRGPGGDGDPSVSANSSGLVHAAWVQSNTACNRAIVRVARRTSSGFAAPETLRGRGSSGRPSVAVGQGGDVIVAWARRLGENRTAIEARFRPARGSWGPLQLLGEGTVAGPVTTAVLQNGRAYVSWSANTFGESNTRSRTYVSVQPAGRTAFRSTTLLEDIRDLNSLQIRLFPVLATAGNSALVAWTGRTGATWQVRVAAARSDGSFGSRQTVSDPAVSSSLGAVSMVLGSTAAVSIARLSTETLPDRVFVAYRPDASAPFGAPEDVGGGSTRSLPLVALDPLTRQPTATWTENLAPPSNSAAKLDVRVRSATRVAS